jgi:hypothetical protein
VGVDGEIGCVFTVRTVAAIFEGDVVEGGLTVDGETGPDARGWRLAVSCEENSVLSGTVGYEPSIHSETYPAGKLDLNAGFNDQ